MKKLLLLIIIIFCSFLTSGTNKKNSCKKENCCFKSTSIKKLQDVHIRIITDSGIIIVKLYDSTPNHRDNFVKLVQQGFYDSLLFHRVIPNFMIQGGDPTSKNAQPGMQLGNGGDTMATIPAEFRTYLFHKEVYSAAAREGDNVNPTKASSACQFYIVTGQKFTDEQLNQMQIGMNRIFTPEEREAYKTIGGAPWLDKAYTIFGEVISGMDVVDKISSMPRDGNDRPLTDIPG